VLTGIYVPLDMAVLLCAAFAAAGLWLSGWRLNRRRDPSREQMHGVIKPHNLNHSLDVTMRRDTQRQTSHAVLHGRIDQFTTGSTPWSPDIMGEVRDHVAAVMRVGLRDLDRIELAEGDGFTIIIPGANERSAVKIAERLRRKLGQLHLPQLGAEARLTASFGVASNRFGENAEALEQRASRALDHALGRGFDLVVPASEIEEATLVPALPPFSSVTPAAVAA
jgi:diguanylate cyclase (GGDEF)-like protein